MKRHERNYSRRMNWKHAIRKRNICIHVYGFEFYHDLHAYSKGKIHCSCGICRPRKWVDAGNNSDKRNSISDQRKLMNMKAAIDDWQYNL